MQFNGRLKRTPPVCPKLPCTTNLQYTQRGPSQRSGPPKLARGSLGDREIRVVRGRKEELGREPERLYLGPDPPSTLTANLH